MIKMYYYYLKIVKNTINKIGVWDFRIVFI